MIQRRVLEKARDSVQGHSSAPAGFPGHWALVPIGDCMEAIIDYRGKSPRKTVSGVPLVTAKIVKGGRILPPEEFIASEDYDSWMRRGLPERGDVVMTTEAPLGEVAQLDGRKVALAQRLITLRGRPEVLNNTFLKFLMQSTYVQDQLQSRATGTTVLGIRQSELRKIELPIPPLREQDWIAEILGSLDDKIELNRRMNETLETIAHAIFKSWHGQMAARCPAVRVQDLINQGAMVVGDGYRAKRSELREEGLPFARAGNVDGGFDFTDAELLGADGVARAGAKVSEPLDCVFTSKGTVGRLAQVTDHTPRFVYAPQLCYWRVADRRKLNPHVLYGWMRGPEFTDQINALKCQTDMADYVSLGDQRRMHISLPPIEDQNAVGGRLELLATEMAEKAAESKTLSAIRDTLLPKLLSGELHLARAEGIVGKCI